MSLSAKASYAVQKAALEDEEIGPLAIAEARTQCPGEAKRAVLTKAQNTWLYNELRKNYVPQLVEADSIYYNHWAGKEEMVLRNKPLLMASLGLSASSAAPALITAKPPGLPQWKALTAATEPQTSAKKPVQSKAKARSSKTGAGKKKHFGKKRFAMKSLADRLLHFSGGSIAEVCRFVTRLVTKLDTSCPGVKAQLLKDEPVVDNQLLQTLGALRSEAVQQGFQSISIADLDRRMSFEGQWPRQFLRKHGYSIGKRAWATMQSQQFVNKRSRKDWEASRKGGAPTKISDHVLQLTRGVLEANSKQGSKVGRVHQRAAGIMGQPHRRGSQAQEVVVHEQSLLKTPGRLWEEHPQLRQHISRTRFYSLLKSHFAQYRRGQRCTDVRTHCQTYYQQIIPRFRKDWKDLQNQLIAVMPSYFAHWPADQTYETVQAEAAAAVAYVPNHCENYRQERAAAGIDRLQLHSFTEAPALGLLRGHRSLLRSYEWHMVCANRQRTNFEKLVEAALPIDATCICFDWKEKVRLPCGPSESSDYWHMQQRYAIAVYGSVVYKHAPDSTAERPKIQHDYFWSRGTRYRL